MNNIQRAIDKQAQLEAEANVEPWAYTAGDTGHRIGRAGQYFTLVSTAFGTDATLIAHLRNQAKLARAVIEAAVNLCNALTPEERASEFLSPEYPQLTAAINAWADHVNGGDK